MSRLLRPVSAERIPVPANHGIGLDDDQRAGPVLELILHRRPEGSIKVVQTRSLTSAVEDGELLPQRKVFRGEVRSVCEQLPHQGEHHLHELKHESWGHLLPPPMARRVPRWIVTVEHLHGTEPTLREIGKGL